MKKLTLIFNILFLLSFFEISIAAENNSINPLEQTLQDKRASLLITLEDEKLLANDTNGSGGIGSRFGENVSIDGDYAFIGANRVRENGVVYIFKFDGTNWNMVTFVESHDITSGDQFGCSVDLLGTKAIIGACGGISGSAYIFELISDVWIETHKLTILTDRVGFGRHVSLSNNRAVIGAQFDDEHGTDSGAVYVFDFDGSQWNETQKITASNAAIRDEFGSALSLDADRLLVGAALTDGIFADSGSAYIFDLIGGTWNEVQILQPDLPQLEDKFGWSVSLDYDRALIGSVGDIVNTTNSGSAYIFELDAVNWVKVQRLSASDKRNADQFGYSVSLENNRAIVGAFRGRNILGGTSGAAYIYELSAGNWDETQKLSISTGTSGDCFGCSLSLDGNNIVSGAFNDDINGVTSGAAFIFNYANPYWSDPIKISAPGGAKNHFGNSVSLSGDIAFVGAPHTNDHGFRSGSVYVYKYNGSNWVQVHKLVASDASSVDLFGWSVSISGSKAIIGAYGDDDNGSVSGSAYIFELVGNTWIETHKLSASDGAQLSFFGWSVELFGDKAIIGAHQHGIQNEGAAYIFELIGNDWIEVQILTASDIDINDEFGWDVSLYDNRALVSSHTEGPVNNNGAVYVFDLSNSTWVESQKLTISDVNTQFGASVSLYGDRALIGASQSAYIFDFFANNWSETQKLVSPDIVGNQRFGFSVSLFDVKALIGAIDRGPNNGGSSIGAAYIFELSGGIWSPINKLMPSDGVIDDEFGNSVSLSGGDALIGSYLSNENGADSGSAYFYGSVGLPTAVDDNINTIGAIIQDANETNLLVLDNDIVNSSQEIVSVTQPQNAIVVNALNRVTYYPDAGYCNNGNPTDDFTYTLDGPTTANVFVTVWCTYDVGGTVYNLLPGNNIILKNTVTPNNSQNLTVNSNGTFAFTAPIYQYILNKPYSVTIETQPNTPNQICTVVNGSGVISGFDIADIEIHCDAIFLSGFE